MSKVWFVTGSSRGLGREFVEAALSRGDKVAATARNTGGFAELVAAYGDAVLPWSWTLPTRPPSSRACGAPTNTSAGSTSS
jgi:NAD(P)-dependent dehydrogenase (short-subunit alcohol dehydrogenase family)